jgi:hypothetical protein
VKKVLFATGTLETVGEGNVFVDEDRAIAALAARVTDVDFNASACPLLAGMGCGGRAERSARAAPSTRLVEAFR